MFLRLLTALTVFFVVIVTHIKAHTHASNWAVLINVSRYWFNYRHASNVFSLYHTIKRLGIPDDRIIAMNADDFACNPRNPFAGTVFNDKARLHNLYTNTTEIDFRNYEVTLDTIIRVLTDRHAPGTARSRRLLSDETSNVLVYFTGHGGDEFMKIQDHEEISAQDIADAVAEMHARRRYRKLFLIFETCQASTMFARIRSPNVFMLAASLKGENSYSHHADPCIGVSVIDRFTYFSQIFFSTLSLDATLTMNDWHAQLSPAKLHSTIATDDHLVQGGVKAVRVTDFVGYVPIATASAGPPVPIAVTSRGLYSSDDSIAPYSWMSFVH
eukprot:jgi/Ulvmu1/2721/UM014_0178.1